ncbi:MAG: hypothetical protein LBC29_05060, partial [Propionibacteriaceae bacterium]|nr:hypothetical protein [Propionibacteriaceae bacterium]
MSLSAIKPVQLLLRVIRKGVALSLLVAQFGVRALQFMNYRIGLRLAAARSADGLPAVSVENTLNSERNGVTLLPALPKLGQRPAVTVLGFLEKQGFYGGVATL